SSFFAASSFLVVLTMPVASMSQPSPSLGKTNITGAPDFLTCCARYSNEMPTTNSPAPDWRQGLEPECVYCAMFSCSASMYFQPSFSPKSCSQAVTSKNPVPLDAGFGMVICPL